MLYKENIKMLKGHCVPTIIFFMEKYWFCLRDQRGSVSEFHAALKNQPAFCMHFLGGGGSLEKGSERSLWFSELGTLT